MTSLDALGTIKEFTMEVATRIVEIESRLGTLEIETNRRLEELSIRIRDGV